MRRPLWQARQISVIPDQRALAAQWRLSKLRAAWLLAGGLLGGFSPAWAQTQAAKPGLPSAISKAFRQSYPGATMLAFSREREKGRIIYEVESRDGSIRRDLLYSLTGKVLEIEETIPATELPVPVRSALDSTAPGATISRAERVTRDGAVTYELTIRVQSRRRSLSLDPAGRPVKP